MAIQPERALKLLDSLDAMAYAARLAWPGSAGRRLRRVLLLALLLAVLAGTWLMLA